MPKGHKIFFKIKISNMKANKLTPIYTESACVRRKMVQGCVWSRKMLKCNGNAFPNE